MADISRNAACPCGSGLKFKRCCLDKVDWEQIIKKGQDPRPYLSVRGRNLAFINKMADLFLFDAFDQKRSLQEYKKCFTAQAVRELNEEIVRLWPPDINLASVLTSSQDGVSGLYIGDYGPDQLRRAVVRHTLYANKILLVDPFIYPLSVRDEFSPILNPEQYRAQTLRNVNLWFSLAPWIHSGLVEVIRIPSDFDHRLQWESMQQQYRKFEENPVLQSAVDRSTDELKGRHIEQMKFRDLLLSAPDASLLHDFERYTNGSSGITKEDLLAYVQRKRDEDPDFLEPLSMDGSGSQLRIMSTGAMYSVACITASMTGSHLITDIESKWKEIELDRAGISEEVSDWSPFAKAIQEVEFKYLNNVEMEDALRLRREDRLCGLRVFLRRIWSQACDTDSFERVNAQHLADELQHEIQVAEEEWKAIDRELLKYAGGTSAGLAASLPIIGSGQGMFLAAASTMAGIAGIAASSWQRHGFGKKHPAAFFLKR